jgi:hypothetical protein
MRSIMLGLIFAMCLSGLTVSTASAGQAAGLELNVQAVKDIATAIGAARKELSGQTKTTWTASLTKTVKVGGKDVTITINRKGVATLSAGGASLGQFEPKTRRDGSISAQVSTIDPKGRITKVRVDVSGNQMSMSQRVFNKVLGLNYRSIASRAKTILSTIVLNVVTQTKANKTREITVATLSGAVSP